MRRRKQQKQFKKKKTRKKEEGGRRKERERTITHLKFVVPRSGDGFAIHVRPIRALQINNER